MDHASFVELPDLPRKRLLRPMAAVALSAVLISAMMIAILLHGSSAGAQSADLAIGGAAYVSTDALNVRSDASLSADVIEALTTGAAMTILDGPYSADGYTWYQVDVDGTTGWVAGEYLSTDAISSDSLSSSGSVMYVNTDGLNVRSAAGLDADVILVAASGAAVTVTGGPESVDGYTWYQVDVDGVSGWVAGEYLASSVGTELAVTTSDISVGSAVYVNTDALNLRATAGLDGEIISTLSTGTTMTVTGGPESVDGYTWYLVDVDGTTGYVAGEYLGLA